MKTAGEVIEVQIGSLLPHPRNYRGHPSGQLRQIAASLKQHGQYRGIVVQKSTNYILAGHAVVEAAKSLGAETVLAQVIDVGSEQAQQILVDDNELSRGAEDDTEALLELLADLQGTEYASHAFTDQEIEALLREVAGPPPMEDPGPGEVREEAITQPGDVWLLGRHRVLCGDCTVATDVLRLCGERKARMVWTDPPYGVDYANHGNNKWGRHDPIANDALDDEGMARLWAEALTLAATVADGDLYVAAPAGPPLTILDETIRDCTPWERHQWLVWVKQQLVLGRSNYHYRHEQICYGWLRGGTSSWSVGRDQDSVFEVDRPSVSEEHPTMKPVELVAPMLENSSQPGDAVYDPFLGSGTTLIAAEKTGRLCYGMEIEGRYCDVAVVRWGLLTAKEAVLESTGQTFSEVRAERGG